MKLNNSLVIAPLCILFTFYAVCVSGGGFGSRSTFAASRKCIQCHSGTDPSVPTISRVTGELITGEWIKSPHNTQSPANTTRFGSSCQGCHGSGHNHPNSCSQCHGNSSPVEATFINPDATLQCNKCHGPRAKREPALPSHYPVITKAMRLSPTIWTNMSSAGYVTAKSTGKCRGCHDPHDITLLQQNRDWAKSGHADTKASSWIRNDFKSQDNCSRCHTATGYVKFLSTGDTAAWAKANSSDKTKEVLRCNGCHVDYSWKRRAGNTKGIDGVQLPYGSFDSTIGLYGKVANDDTSTVINDTGNSNLCINCHSGLASGRAIALGNEATLLHNSFVEVDPHSFAAAGNLYAISGYEYRPHDDYLLIDPITGTNFFVHDHIGLDGSIGLGTNRGPCVGCHMDNKGHTFMPVALTPAGSGPRGLIDGTITAFPAVADSCGKCHTLGEPHDLSFGAASDIRNRKSEYKTRLAELETLLESKYGIVYDPDNFPYFWPDTVTNHTNPDYAYGSPGNQTSIPPVPAQPPWPDKGVLGAAFNLNTCFRDPGGYAHNYRYTSRLIYDSLDYLDDGLLNNSYTSSAFPSGRPL
jgi:hypothetical protein